MIREHLQQNLKKNPKKSLISIRAQAPGKLIISGEHAVLYGRKAFINAISLFTTCEVDYLPINSEPYFNVILDSNHDIQSYDLNRKYSLDEFEKSLNNKLLAFILKTYDRLIPGNISLKIKISSSIPQNRGMGSSAALIVSLIEAFDLNFNINYSFNEKFILAKKFEDVQHGQSSGADLITSFQGGLNLFQDGHLLPHELSIPIKSWHLVDSGRKKNPTKVAVDHVKSIWSRKIELNFIELEKDFLDSLLLKDINKFKECIKKNHYLLKQLGVVPLKVQEFVRKIEQAGGAAKISGSGAISGDAAGAVIVFGCDQLEDYCQEFEYQFKNIKGEDRGVKIY